MSISFPSADFAPTLSGYTGQGAFRFWCQKVLPIVYDDSLSYYELLCKVVAYLNNTISDVATAEDNIGLLDDSYIALQNFVNEFKDATEEAVNGAIEYIDNYFNELVIKDALNINSKSVSPLYIGDYFENTDYLPSCCIRDGESFYSIECLTPSIARSEHTNNGKVRKFTLGGVNSEDTTYTKTVKVGHANSCCYVPEDGVLYIAPIWDYEQYDASEPDVTQVEAFYLWRYDFPDFTNRTKIETPTVARGVSYDFVNDKLYYYDGNNNIYIYNNGVWDLYSNVDFSSVPDYDYFVRVYNQDFSVYNGVLYLSSPYQNVLYGMLTPGTCKPSGGFIVGLTDSSSRFYLGELEGMEFGSDGRLYCVNYVSLTNKINDVFIMELPFGASPPGFSGLGGILGGVHTGTVTLSPATQTCFAITSGQLRGLPQLECMLLSERTSRVNITDGVDENYTVRITRDIELIIDGTYTVNSFEVFSGTLMVGSNEVNHNIIFRSPSYGFYVGRNGGLSFIGNIGLRVSFPNNEEDSISLILIGGDMPTLKIRILPVNVLDNKDLCINDKKIVVAGLYYGNTNVDYYTRNDAFYVYRSTAFSGHVFGSGRVLVVFIPVPKRIIRGRNTPIVQMTDSQVTEIKLTVRCAKGSILGAAGTSLNLKDTSKYSLQVTAQSQSVIRLRVESINDEFNHDCANAPISAEFETDVTFSFSSI